MKAGKLRHRVTIKQKSVSRDSYGAEDITWQVVATVWAAVEPLQGREFIDGKQLQAERTTRIRIRYRSGVAPEMRVVFGSHVYDVQSVIEPETRNRELVLMCKEAL